MDNMEKKLSDYIDSLNAEKKPELHERPAGSPELEKLASTVRMVRTLKEPHIPGNGYQKKLAAAVAGRLSKRKPGVKSKLVWLAGMAAVAAVVAVIFLVNLFLPFGNTNIVHAMEQAFQEVKAYHGILEIAETNADGTETIQAKREVWVNKEGYYIKEIKGRYEGLITVNNGQKKWQVRPDEKKVYIFTAFPDPYRFTFELGNEVKDVKNALETKVVGEDRISGRKASILEVKPRGGLPYRIWIDKETRLPLQKQSAMQNGLQYRITYTEIEFIDSIPGELFAYELPEGFEEIDINPEQLVNNPEEAAGIAGFTPVVPENIPEGYRRDGIAVLTGGKAVKFYFTAPDGKSRVVVLQGRSSGEFKPATKAVLGKVGSNVAEIQSSIEESAGILAGEGAYAGVTGISSIRWQKDGFEYAVVGDVPLEELAAFVESMTGETVEVPAGDNAPSMKPQIEVPVDMEIEENEQKSVDAGHLPWRLDPVYVAQVFVSLKISPEGIQGEYPVKYEELKVVENTGIDAIVEVSSSASPVRRVYLKRLIRQDSTGIWTVVGYDPADAE